MLFLLFACLFVCLFPFTRPCFRFPFNLRSPECSTIEYYFLLASGYTTVIYCLTFESQENFTQRKPSQLAEIEKQVENPKHREYAKYPTWALCFINLSYSLTALNHTFYHRSVIWHALVRTMKYEQLRVSNGYKLPEAIFN